MQDPELERIALAALCAAARDALPALRGGTSDGADASHGSGVNGVAGRPAASGGYPMLAPKVASSMSPDQNAPLCNTT